ncbi:MAG: Coproporphyrinogen dehydrogenase [Frankiales bacterium]|nr:Coproporphyrinogen dehydrogenase [Frankiales bacterium]
MPSTLPDGNPAPVDGALPASALEGAASRPFGGYLHVPFCATRCGYCDFNTYTASELGGRTDPVAYVAAARAELDLARTVLGDSAVPASTVFIGGGTPTLLGAPGLVSLLDGVRDTFGIAVGAEITTEANPESVDPAMLDALLAGGFTRISFGMQSAAPHVLAVLERRHTPGRALDAAREARKAGFGHVNLDLIYGTPGESDDDWRHSIDAALSAEPDHVSAYALIVEDGTKLAAQVRRGELPLPDDDVLADRYAIADEALTAAGLPWYEVSNWAADRDARCRHNELYWTGGDWWGIGPGAHSHIGGIRWWNVKHPAAYAQRLSEGSSPAHARESLTSGERYDEDVLLGVRLADGFAAGRLRPPGLAAVPGLVGEGLVDGPAWTAGRLVLTCRGRLLADHVVRTLLG